MTHSDIQPLLTVYLRRISTVDMSFKRYLHSVINWNARLIGIKGPRGVGKTTLLLQHIRENFANSDDAIWLSLDNFWFKTHSLDELVEWLYTHGRTAIYLDEVHKYPDWALHIKNYYDNYPDLRIIYTGSSMLNIDNSNVDLSRRQTVYTLPIMSFREYLQFENITQTGPITLDQLLIDHQSIAMSLCRKCKILNAFDQFNKIGQYPFYKENPEDYLSKLATATALVIENDLPSTTDITYATIEKMKKLLMIISENVPFIPNISKLCASLSTTRDSCLRMLYLLDRANVIKLLHKELRNYKSILSPEKIYMANTNLMEAFSSRKDIGNMRETYFISQIQPVSTVQMPTKGDFLINGDYTIEVGGPSKSFEQIKNINNSYLAIDGIEIGDGERIPLWMFGLLY